MDEEPQGLRIAFDLLESSGIGLVGLDERMRVCRANANAGRYLSLDPAAILGRDAVDLRAAVRFREFWELFPRTCYCLAPGPSGLLLIVSRTVRPEPGQDIHHAIILRPYSLEREFSRMRARLSNFLAHEIAAHLNSIGIASDLITEPELLSAVTTREAFLSTFRHDVSDLNTLFVQLLETAEPLSLPNRVSIARCDWRGLVEDLVAKMRGLASERSVVLSCTLPPHLPSPAGDYHWLYLAMFGVLSQALRLAPPLSEVVVAASSDGGTVRTLVESAFDEHRLVGDAWPPAAVFPLEEADPRISQMEIGELAVTRSIFLLFGGDVERRNGGGRVSYSVSLPA